jgi:acyl carrier protein phosphodiesterase
MNLLAHALLSPPQPAILVGNLTADWVKGKARHTLPEDIRLGMHLHQAIDSFTDTHPLVEHCCSLLSEKWERYSPVLVDIFFDHILSIHWPRYCTLPRDRFIARIYAVLRAHHHLLPPRAQYAASALLADDWLSTYATLDGIALSLSRLSTRLQHGIELAPAVADLRVHQLAFEDAFHRFFPDLQKHVESRLALPLN